jgi:hypothetical protein
MDRRTAIFELGGMAAGLLLAGCGQPRIPSELDMSASDAADAQWGILAGEGLTGQLGLIDLRSIPGYSFRGDFSGQSAGSAFYFSGYQSGSVEGKTETMVQFAWRTNHPTEPRILVSEIPFNKVAWDTRGEESASPSVAYRFRVENGLVRSLVFSCSDTNRCYRPQRFMNPNDYVKFADLTTFTVSPSQFSSFRAPQPQ